MLRKALATIAAAAIMVTALSCRRLMPKRAKRGSEIGKKL